MRCLEEATAAGKAQDDLVMTFGRMSLRGVDFLSFACCSYLLLRDFALPAL
jgi:hypothetical protein